MGLPTPHIVTSRKTLSASWKWKWWAAECLRSTPKMAYFELVKGGQTIAAFSSLPKAKEAYAKVAAQTFGLLHFKDYDEARAFIFEAGMENDLYIQEPEVPDEDEIFSSLV
jgi:hypothetical protein